MIENIVKDKNLSYQNNQYLLLQSDINLNPSAFAWLSTLGISANVKLFEGSIPHVTKKQCMVYGQNKMKHHL